MCRSLLWTSVPGPTNPFPCPLDSPKSVTESIHRRVIRCLSEETSCLSPEKSNRVPPRGPSAGRYLLVPLIFLHHPSQGQVFLRTIVPGTLSRDLLVFHTIIPITYVHSRALDHHLPPRQSPGTRKLTPRVTPLPHTGSPGRTLTTVSSNISPQDLNLQLRGSLATEQRARVCAGRWTLDRLGPGALLVGCRGTLRVRGADAS